jgi:hypothetical protein
MLRRQPRDLGFTSSTACLLLLHKPNQFKIRPASKASTVSLEVRQWSLALSRSCLSAAAEAICQPEAICQRGIGTRIL